MKLLLENWRKYVNEEQDVFAKQLIEEGLLDVVKDSAASLKALKNKAYEQALKQFISISGKISDKSAPIKVAIQKHLPSPVQIAVLTAISLAIAAAGKPDLAQKIIAGSVSVADVLGALSVVLEENEELEEGWKSKLALGAALAGAGGPAMAQDTGGVDTGEKTQQVDKAEDTSELVKNDDGTHSLTLDIPAHFQKLMPSMKRTIITNWARAEFAKKMAGALDGDAYQLEMSGRLTAMTPDTVTFTGMANIKK